MFDNTLSHQRCADNALSARKMPKNPNKGWTHHKDGPKMRNGTFGPNETSQELYYLLDHPTMPGWFKGMEQIIRERDLWPEKDLLAQCPGFKCASERTDCCCRCLLFRQPDFMAQKSELEEFITAWGHICDFYPKFHCELNFIEQYWGAVKYLYRNTAKTADMDAMEWNVLECLDEVPLLQIRRYVTTTKNRTSTKSDRRYANCSARFISVYAQGLSGSEAVWANWKYHGHQTLPAHIVQDIKNTFHK